MESDVSRRTVTVLVILTIVISVLGSLSVMSVVAEIKNTEATSQASAGQGWVGLEITGSKETVKAEPSGATGNILLEIKA